MTKSIDGSDTADDNNYAADDNNNARKEQKGNKQHQSLSTEDRCSDGPQRNQKQIHCGTERMAARANLTSDPYFIRPMDNCPLNDAQLIRFPIYEPTCYFENHTCRSNPKLTDRNLMRTDGHISIFKHLIYHIGAV